MGYREAIDAGAIAMFTEKYGDRVRVVSFGGVSTELCGGTHAKATGDIGVLQIVSQSGIAAGVRRIEALTGLGALRFVREREKALRRVGELLRVPPQQAPERVEKLLEERKEKEREIAELRRARHRGPAAAEAQAPPREIGGVRVLVREVEGVDGKELRDLVDDLRGQVKSGVVLVASKGDGRVSLALGVTPDLRDRIKAGDLVREIATIVGGKGGGRPDFAQAGGTAPEKLPRGHRAALRAARRGRCVSARAAASPFVWRRRLTREVKIGGVGVGGANPIRIQSMTTTDTRDTAATVAQCERLVAAGCEILRVTAPSITDAENLAAIRAELSRRGVDAPLVADIHFTPNAAHGGRAARREGADQPRQLRRQEALRAARVRRRRVRGRDRARAGALPPAGEAPQAARPRAPHRHEPRLALRPHPEPLRRHAARHGRERARVPRRLRGRGLLRSRVQHEGEQPAGRHPGLPAARGAARGSARRAGRPTRSTSA